MKSKEIKIAITAVIAVVIVYLGIVFMKGLKLFSSDNIYYVEMKNVGGLSKAGEVIANGMNIGVVKDITYDGNRQMLTVAVELNEGFSLPRNSHATTVKDMLGAPKMNIILGENPRDLLAIGDTISGEGGGDLMSSIGEMVPQLKALMPKLDSILANINALSANPALSQTLENAGNASANLNKSTILLNQMLQGEIGNLAQSLKASGANVQAFTDKLAKINVNSSVQDVNRMLSDLNVVSADLKNISGNVSGFTGDLGELSKNLQHLLTNVNTLSSSLDNTINDLNRQLNSKDNTAGMLLNDRQLYDNLNATASSLNATAKSADSLLTDLKAHPKRYVHFSVFGRKDKK